MGPGIMLAEPGIGSPVGLTAGAPPWMLIMVLAAVVDTGQLAGLAGIRVLSRWVHPVCAAPALCRVW